MINLFFIIGNTNQQNISKMQRQKLLLPTLNPPLASTRISNYEDYREWEKQKKKAYRAQLQQDIEEHNRSREKSHQLKLNQRNNLNSLVQKQRRIESLQRSAKIKTEQKYMQENFNLMKQQSKSPRRIAETIVYKQHPFVDLVDKQQRRREETKNSFIYQNKLNDMQSEMKRSMKARKKLFEAEQRRKYIDHVQEEFNKHQEQRKFFQNKYLKIDKNSKKNFKKEHLQFLREQAQSRKQMGGNRTNRIFSQRFDESNESINATAGNMGQTPLHYDRKRQLETLQKSLKLFSTPKSHLQSSLSVHKQYDLQMGGITRRNNYQKIVTQKSTREVSQNKQVLRTERAQSSLNGNIIKYKPFALEMSQRQVKPVRQPRQYKQFDIIKGTDKIFVR